MVPVVSMAVGAIPGIPVATVPVPAVIPRYIAVRHVAPVPGRVAPGFHVTWSVITAVIPRRNVAIVARVVRGHRVRRGHIVAVLTRVGVVTAESVQGFAEPTGLRGGRQERKPDRQGGGEKNLSHDALSSVVPGPSPGSLFVPL